MKDLRGRQRRSELTPEEHRLLMLMLARIFQEIDSLTEILKSRDIATADDLKAFRFAAWDDDGQVLQAVAKARAEYLKIAEQAGVEVPPGI